MSDRIAFVAASNGPAGPSQLKYAFEDQARLSRMLGSRVCGFKVAGTTPTSSVADLREGIFIAAERCRPGDTLVVSFAGHGIVDGDELFLLWNDSDPERLLQTALPGRDVFSALNRSRATSKLLILDCCRAGAVLGGGFRSTPETSLSEVTAQASSFLMLLASDRLEKAREIDSLSGGFLTVALCEALQENADPDNDGQTSLADAVDWIRRRANEYNKTHQSKQVPIPLVVGKERAPVILTNTSAWEPWTFRLGSVEMVVLPLVGDLYFHAVAISKCPITNAQYREFVADVGDRLPNIEPAGYAYNPELMSWEEPFKPWDDPQYQQDDLPVVCVDYRMAQLYCSWLGSQFGNWSPIRRPTEGVELSRAFDETQIVTLPTPAEWSFAAYGDFEPLSSQRAGRRMFRTPVRAQLEIHQRSEMPALIDRYGARANSFGVSDMFGNVWEWCLGVSTSRYRRASILQMPEPRSEPDDPGVSPRTVELRGGGYLDDASMVVPYIRASELKDGLRTSHTDLGFRVSTFVRTGSLPAAIEESIGNLAVPLPPDEREFRRLPTGQ